MNADNFRVMVDSRNSLTTEGFIDHFQVQVQGHTLQLYVCLLPIAGADLVLGASRLATMGPPITDYSSLLIKFYLNNHFCHTLWGQSRSAMPDSISPISFVSFFSIINSQCPFYFAKFHEMIHSVLDIETYHQ